MPKRKRKKILWIILSLLGLIIISVIGVLIFLNFPLDSEDGIDGECNESYTIECGSDIGECQKGIRTCINGSWGECEGETPPEDEICDELDNNCDGEIDEGCEDEDEGRIEASGKIIVWYHAWGENTEDIHYLAESEFVTHVVISNLDFDEQKDSSIVNKIQIVRDNGLIPIWERDLWFQRGDNPREGESQQFAEFYTDGSILHNTDYFEWFLKKLRQEADQYGVDLIAIDAEPYGPFSGQLKDYIRQNNPTEFARIQQSVSEALSREGVEQAGYIFPTSFHPESMYAYNSYKALRNLGKNKITENTFFDCDSRLEEFLGQNLQLIGAWATHLEDCYRTDNSCILGDDEDYFCSITDYDNDEISTALWGAQTIFDNADYWYDVDRGLFIYVIAKDQKSFAQELASYCQENRGLCDQYSFSGN